MRILLDENMPESLRVVSATKTDGERLPLVEIPG